MNRVELIVDTKSLQEVFKKRNEVMPLKTKAVWVDFQEKNGHGRTGQVKKASFARRSITLLNTKLNRGSAIDFINALIDQTNSESFGLNKIEKLKKGNCIFGGSSDAEIQKRFTEIKISVKMLAGLKEETSSNGSSDGDYIPGSNDFRY